MSLARMSLKTHSWDVQESRRCFRAVRNSELLTTASGELTRVCIGVYKGGVQSVTLDRSDPQSARAVLEPLDRCCNAEPNSAEPKQRSTGSCGDPCEEDRRAGMSPASGKLPAPQKFNRSIGSLPAAAPASASVAPRAPAPAPPVTAAISAAAIASVAASACLVLFILGKFIVDPPEVFNAQSYLDASCAR